MKTKRITTGIVTDALGILSTDSLEGNLYMFDDNRLGGSFGEGTSGLVTVLDFGDNRPDEYELAWFVMNLRPDVSVEITDMRLQSDDVTAERQVYDETDVTYWIIRVKNAFDTLKGTVSLRIAGRPELFTHDFTIMGKEAGDGQ